MLDKEKRYYVQRMKEARSFRLIIDEGSDNQLELKMVGRDTRKLTHDIGIALQDYFLKH